MKLFICLYQPTSYMHLSIYCFIYLSSNLSPLSIFYLQMHAKIIADMHILRAMCTDVFVYFQTHAKITWIYR